MEEKSKGRDKQQGRETSVIDRNIGQRLHLFEFEWFFQSSIIVNISILMYRAQRDVISDQVSCLLPSTRRSVLLIFITLSPDTSVFRFGAASA